MTTTHLSIADAFMLLLREPADLRFTAYDGSTAGPDDAPFEFRLTNERGLSYLMSSRDPDLGIGRAYVAGDLVLHGAHPGDPYPALAALKAAIKLRRPTPAQAVQLLRSLGAAHLLPPPPPPQERPSKLRRRMSGVSHSLHRDAESIEHHYDVSNRFYEMVLGPTMAYTCAVFPKASSSLEEAQAEKFDLVARKLDLRPGQRLLDLGCGWGGMVRHAAREYGVRALGVTLSQQQAAWAQEAIDADGLGQLAGVRHLDYRHVAESDFDAISSIGLTEHVGVRNYGAYFGFVRSKLRPEGRLLNHCITRSESITPPHAGQFIDRYVFPDGELTSSGVIIDSAENAGLEVQHSENFRRHYAKTLAAWNQNLVENWDECLAEVGENTARVWGLYMAGSRLAFDRNELQLHHVLATKTTTDGESGYPLRHTF